MKTLAIFLFASLLSITCMSQKIRGEELLDKAIKYHDPEGNWKTFNGKLYVTMEIPNKSNRDSEITINLPKQYFNLIARRDTVTNVYTIKKGNCIISKQDSIIISKQNPKPQRSYCETAKLYKDYYTYLYGLPMKLKDSGTHIHDKVELKRFKGNDYLVLKVTYDASVGSDIWYFYFNPKTYALKVYQFFKTDEQGKLKPDSGEYILLKEETVINNIKIPKIRAWYYNKDNMYLGTDVLK